MTPFSFKPIGWLKTPFIDKFGTPRQGRLAPAAEARIEWAEGTHPEPWLDGLAGFSHVWLITVFHEHFGKPSPNKIHPPRLGGRRVGVLASRSPHRPNPIGLTLARVVAVKGSELILSEVDLIDRTPILDLKPYVPEADKADHAKAGWVEENPWVPLPVHFLEDSERNLDELYQKAPPPLPREQFKQLIEQSLSADPRAVADRRDPIVADARPRWFWLRLYDLDVGFYFSLRGVEVAMVRPVLKTSDLAPSVTG